MPAEAGEIRSVARLILPEIAEPFKGGDARKWRFSSTAELCRRAPAPLRLVSRPGVRSYVCRGNPPAGGGGTTRRAGGCVSGALEGVRCRCGDGGRGGGALWPDRGAEGPGQCAGQFRSHSAGRRQPSAGWRCLTPPCRLPAPHGCLYGASPSLGSGRPSPATTRRSVHSRRAGRPRCCRRRGCEAGRLPALPRAHRSGCRRVEIYRESHPTPGPRPQGDHRRGKAALRMAQRQLHPPHRQPRVAGLEPPDAPVTGAGGWCYFPSHHEYQGSRPALESLGRSLAKGCREAAWVSRCASTRFERAPPERGSGHAVGASGRTV